MNLLHKTQALKENPGARIVAGGGIKDEKLVATPYGIKEGRRPDTIIERADGSQFGINVGKTKADGTTLIKREAQALKDLNENGNLPTIFVRYNDKK